MKAILTLLLPHVSRWRSLAILVDRWETMQAALRDLSQPILTGGREGPMAPILESLVLMRCNEWPSFGHYFSPLELMNPLYMPFGAGTHQQPSVNGVQTSSSPFPRLKTLVLWGTHVDWTKLPHLLPTPSSQSPLTGSLRCLELAYHSGQVRQTRTDFRKMLQRCPLLEELTIRVSGPRYDDEHPQGGSPDDDDARTPVVLSHLSVLALGFDDRQAAMEFLRLVRFPGLRQLSLENRAHYAESSSDAGPILEYCASGMGPNTNHGGTSSFASLDTLILHSIKSRWQSFALFFAAVPKLTSLTLWRATTCAIEALKPQFRYTNVYDPPTAFCPCPKLEYLTIEGNGDEDLFSSCSTVAEDRARIGKPIREIHFDIPGYPADEDEDGVTLFTFDSLRGTDVDFEG